MKKYIILFLFCFSFILFGCKDSGSDFIGSWVQVTEQKYPTRIDVKYDDGVYHVDVKYLDPILVSNKKANAFSDYMLGKTKERPSGNMDLSDCYKVKNLEAKALNKRVLQGDNVSLRLEKGEVKYNGEVYIKE